MLGLQPAIFSHKVKSQLYGAQYLHKPIPGLCSQEPNGLVTTHLLGRPEHYAQRVYGDAHKVTSWSRTKPIVGAWDLRAAYSKAWEQFQPNIINGKLGPDDIKDMLGWYDLVISTVPLWSICTKPRQHIFNSIAIMVKPEIYIDIDGEGDNHVYYNGTEEGDWYRASQIFGHSSTEARANPHLAAEGWSVGYKVVGNTCDCHQGLVRAGRMGEWRSGVLTHHAFDIALASISEHITTPYQDTVK
jgi:hypothetical protein